MRIRGIADEMIENIVSPPELIKKTHRNACYQWYADYRCGHCGKIFNAKINNVKQGTTKSCGCFKRKQQQAKTTTRKCKHVLSDGQTVAAFAKEHNLRYEVVYNRILRGYTSLAALGKPVQQRKVTKEEEEEEGKDDEVVAQYFEQRNEKEHPVGTLYPGTPVGTLRRGYTVIRGGENNSAEVIPQQ